jgi:hypothetical protein
VNSFGLVRIGFNENMNIKDIEQLLKEQKVVIRDKYNGSSVSPIIEVNVVNDVSSKVQFIKFDWKFTKDFTTKYFTI